MAFFGVRVDDCVITRSFFNRVSLHMKIGNLVTNPYVGGVKNLEKGLYGIIMDPVYPKFYYIGFLFLLASVLLTWNVFSWWNLPGLLLSCLGFFYSKYFFFFMLVIGLKKAGYNGKTRLVGLNKLGRCFFYGSNRSLRTIKRKKE